MADGAAAPEAGATAGTAPAQHSYLQILKSTALIGGSSVITILFSIVRNKAMAILLGPQGVGLMGLYNAVADLAQTLAGLGIQESGVRQIAEAVGTGDKERIARVAIVLRRVALGLGLLGAVLLAAASLPVASFTFGDGQHAAALALLALAVMFRLVSAGQMALVQGLRRIADLAKINVLGAFYSTAIGIPMVYWLGTDGIVPTLVAMAAASVLTSWWYARKVEIAPVRVASAELKREVASLLNLGVVFMASALLTAASAYAVRLIVLRLDGAFAAGLYQASWTLGGLYAGFVLQAMGTDFYPRLTAVAGDNEAANRLVNEQTQISLLLAGPGVLGTLTVAPIVISLFYTGEFQPAVGVLRWICLGMMLRIVSWPMGYIIIAKGARTMFFVAEVAATVAHVGLALLLVPWVGVAGAGIAFFGLYVWHTLLVLIMARRLTGFTWSPANARLGLIFLPASALVMAAVMLLPFWPATAIGLGLTLVTGLYALHQLVGLMPYHALPRIVRLIAPKPR